jgi:hypothetical protein
MQRITGKDLDRIRPFFEAAAAVAKHATCHQAKCGTVIASNGDFTDAGEPYCTTCSRLTLEAGIGQFALWNDNGADLYNAAEYNKKSYAFFT